MLLVVAGALVPIARMASTRLILMALGGLAVASALHLSGGHLDGAWVTPLVAASMVLCGWLGARRRSDSVPWPTVDLGDGLVMVGGLALLSLLILPYWGLDRDGILLDLGRGFDNLMHLEMFANVVGGGVESEVNQAYPTGFHTLLFLLDGGSLQGVPRAALIPSFGVSSAFMAASAAVICGWTAVGIAGSLHSCGARRRASRAAAGLAYGLFMCLGGLYAGMFEVGHVAFLLPAAVVVAASWLALRTGVLSWSAAAIVGLAAWGVLGAYPPLLAGLVPAGVWLVHTALGHRGRSSIRRVIPGLAVVVAVAVFVIVDRWGEHVIGIWASTGEVSTPIASILIYSALGLALAWIAARSGLSLRVSIWGSTLGYASLGLAIAALAAAGGDPVLSSYYAQKLLQAAWLAGSVVVIGLVAALVVGDSAFARFPQWVGMALRGSVLIAVLGVLLAVPDARYWDVKGAVPTAVEQVQRRTSEAERAQDELRVLAVAAAVGDDPDEVVILADPQGWLLPFVVEDATRSLSTATWAVNVVRGPLTRQTGEVARCMAGPDGADLLWGCAVGLASRDPDVTVSIVVEDPVLADSLRNAGVDVTDSIRVDVLEHLLNGRESGLGPA